MTKISVSNKFLSAFFIGLLCGGTLWGQANSDSVYYDYINIKGVAYDVKLREKPGYFELNLRGAPLHGHIDSSSVAKGGRPNLVVDSFATALSDSPVRQLPVDFDQDLYITRLFAVLTGQVHASNSSSHVLAALQGDPELQQEFRLSYQRIKKELLVKTVEKRLDTAQARKEREIASLNEGHRKTIDSLLNIIDVVDEENRYGGQFEFVDNDSTGVPVYTTGRRLLDTAQVRFFPNSVVIRTFNNFIDLVHISGVVQAAGRRYPVVCYNPNYSIPLKHLYMRNQYVVFTIPDSIGSRGAGAKRDYTWRYMINASDLFRVSAYKNHFTFMVKNDAYALSRKDSVVPYQRRSFYDYLNFTTFLDFLGVAEKTPNSLIQLEGRVRLPMQLTNSRLINSYNNVWFPKIDVYLNAAFVNGSQEDNRFGTVFNPSSNSANLDTLFMDHFDLVRKYNIHSGLEVGLFKKEYKSKNINAYLDYSLRSWRTTLNYTIVNNTGLDEHEQFDAWSWTHGPILRFEYRPDLNIGGDFSFAADFNQKILNSDNENLYVYEVSGPLNRNLRKPAVQTLSDHRRTNYKAEFNVYYMVNPRRSNGGLYFRASNYFNYKFTQLFPQIMVGYSTRLTGMINNISGKARENQ